MENDLLGIGRLAALSGLPVSALRFYDGVGVLTPARVDPSSGYRFYRPAQVAHARVVAHLRRVGLGLDDIRSVMADPGCAASILAGHLGRLEAELADARREISIVHQLLETTETTMYRCTLPAADLLRALREVRHAVSDDPDQPRLGGVLLDSEPGAVRLVATDRHRLATSRVVTAEPTELHVLLPAAAVDQLLSGAHAGSLDVTVADGTITVTGDAGTVRAAVPDVDFPSYRSLLQPGHRTVPVDAAALRAALTSGPTEVRRRDGDGAPYELSTLSITGTGVDVVATGTPADPDAVVVGVNRAFLLQALDARQDGDGAMPGGQLELGLDDPIRPLSLRDPDRDGAMSILMPVRLDQPA